MPAAVIGIAGSVAGSVAAGAVGGGIIGGIVGGIVSTAVTTIGAKVLGVGAPRQSALSALAQERERGVLVNTASAVEPVPVIYGTVRVGGIRVFGPHVTGADNSELHMVIVWGEGPVAGIDDIYLDEVSYTDSRFAGLVEVYHHLGDDDQAADTVLAARVSQWTTAHRLRGLAYTYIRLLGNDVFQGLPAVSALVRGRTLYDPRTATTGFSSNPALVIRDYLTHSRYGRGLASSSIDDASFQAAADYCDELVSVPDGTQARYRCDGVVDTARTLSANMRDLLSSCRGSLVFSGGAYKLRIDQADSAVMTLDEDTITGRWSFEIGRQADRLNRVKARFLDASRSYQPALAVVDDATALAADNNLRLATELALPFTTDRYRAQQIAGIELRASRQQIVVRLTATLDALQLEPFDVVAITHPTPGWTSKLFRVARMELLESGEVGLTLVEHDASVYTLDSLSAVSPAPDTNLPNPWAMPAPGVPAVTEALYSTRAGGVKSRATVTWAATADAFVARYQVDAIRPGESTWTTVARTDQLRAVLDDLAPGTLQVRVRAQNVAGGWSSYSNATVEILGLAAPPAALTGLTLSAIGGLAVLRWDQAADLDVREGGRIEFRHSPLQSGASWSGSTSIGDAVPGSHTVAVLPLRQGTYLAKAVDSSGIRSTTAATVSTKAGTALAFTNLSSLAEETAFPGTHSSTVAVDGVLKLAGAGLVDDIPDVDAVPDWDSYGGIASSGTYTFSGGLDLGAVKRVRLTKRLAAQVVDAVDDWDSRTTLMDTWPDVDGVEGSEADVTVWVRETDDDPAASPTWSAWQRLDSAEYEARGFELQARLSATGPTYNVRVSQLGVTADEVI